ncbi:hypothetical protein CORC01_04199 [Colletotrichum orchidophilum]|uniref:Uncharacterized protein n=1 Tax=Colletotrichum orchidophilum TaxID=1209926 RepID=A0A1G4BGE0_9PEZI|nr:uncharacterized protein CORC01_04199 [Colletotrichum orchidophilum]OHF00449.1 hypothetical protein CORC01_04199 [Colletotrichum orchidophilum]
MSYGVSTHGVASSTVHMDIWIYGQLPTSLPIQVDLDLRSYLIPRQFISPLVRQRIQGYPSTCRLPPPAAPPLPLSAEHQQIGKLGEPVATGTLETGALRRSVTAWAREPGTPINGTELHCVWLLQTTIESNLTIRKLLQIMPQQAGALYVKSRRSHVLYGVDGERSRRWGVKLGASHVTCEPGGRQAATAALKPREMEITG